VTKPKWKPSWRVGLLWGVLFAVTIGGVVLVGVLYYFEQQHRVTSEAHEQLAVIADLKVRQIANWRRECFDLARKVQESPFVAPCVAEFLAEAAPANARSQLLAWMRSVQRNEHVNRVVLLDGRGEVRLVVPADESRIGELAGERARTASRTGQLVTSDLHRSTVLPGELVNMDFFVPIIARPGEPPLAVVMLEILADKFLFPLVQSWPTASPTAETLLVRRDGDEVVFLNELRHRTNTALRLRSPMGMDSLPAAMAVRGQGGVVAGVDYRGQPVLAALARVPDSPWFMVAKVDQEEVYAPLRQQVRLTTAVVATVVVALTFGLVLLWRRRAERFLRRELAAAERVRHAVQRANDIILLADAEWRIVEANERAVQVYGYTMAELRQMRLPDLRSPAERPKFAEQFAALDKRNGMVLETEHQRRDGSVFFVEASVRGIAMDGRTVYQSIIRDITERKRAAAEIQRLTRLYATLSQVNQAIVRVTSREELAQEVGRVLVEFGRYKLAWVGWHDAPTGRITPAGWAGTPREFVTNTRHSSTPSSEHGCVCGTAIRENRSCVVNDLLNSPLVQARRAEIAATGLRAAVSLPLHCGGVPCGMITAYADEPNVFNDKEVALLEECALDVSFCLDHLQKETQRQEAERALRYERNLLGSLIAAMPDHVYFKDRDSRFLRINEAFARSAGLSSPEEAVGKTDFDLFREEHARQAHADEQRIVATGEPLVGIEEKETWPDGRITWASTTKVPMRDATGKLLGLVGISRDITGQKQAEDQLREHQRLLGSVVETAPNLLVLADEAGRIQLFNRACEQLTGYHQEEVLGQTIADLFLPAEWIPLVQQRFANPQAADLRVPHVNPWKTKAGELRTVEWRCAVVPGPDGAGSWVLGAGVDITDRLRTEEQLRRQASVINQSTDTVAITDLTGRITDVNEAQCRALGATREELIGRNVVEVYSRGDPKIAAVQQEILAATLRQGEWQGRATNLTADGKRILIEVRTWVLRDEEGQPIGLCGVGQDVTRQADLEDQLRQSQKMEAVGHLAGGVAHDFNNLLNVILGYSDLLMQRGDWPASAHEQLRQIHQAGERAATLTRQLLAFSRKQILEPKVFEVGALVADMSKMLRRLIGENITLNVAAPAQPCYVTADPGQLEQVIMNLSVNARDAMPQGGTLTIATRPLSASESHQPGHPPLPPGEHVMLAVSDTGTGMTEEVKARLFEPFFTTKEVGKGTGLGLATCHGIIKQSGGEIVADSEPGQGTVFKIYLPRVAAPPTTQDAEPALIVPRGKGETILLAEDEEAVRTLAALVLEELGYRVVKAGNGDDALALVTKQPVDLLLTDVIMPGRSGRELADCLKAAHPGLKVIFISGYTENAIAHHGILDPGVTFLPKPFTTIALARKVREALDSGPG